MKKKHNFRGKLVFSVLLVLSFFVLSSNVYAEDVKDQDKVLLEVKPSDSFCNDFQGNDRTKCKQTVALCSQHLTNEVNDYGIDANVNGNDVLTYGKIRIGKYTVDKKVTVTNNDKPISSGQKISSSRFNTVIFETQLADKDLAFTDSNGSNININCTGSYKKVYMFDDTTPTSTGGFKNPSCKTGGMCYKYLNEKSKTGDSSLDGTYSYQAMQKLGNVTIKGKSMGFPEFLTTYFSYCDCQKEVNYILDDNYIKKSILTLAMAFKSEYNAEKYNEEIKSKNQTITFDPDAILLDYSDPKNRKAIKLTCDAFGPTTQELQNKKDQNKDGNNEIYVNNNGKIIPKYEEIKSEGKVIGYNNYRKFASKGQVQTETYKAADGTEKGACTVQCGEQVEVSYGPPVAVKGTVCFEYIITVKSKIMCESKVISEKPQPPEPTTAKTCNMTIKCNAYTGIVEAQAGPNEEFDSCVQTKFNGKYTQKAINYCYNKVYKKKNKSKVNNTLTDATGQKMANSNRWWCDDDILRKIDQNGSYNGKTIADVWKAVQDEAKEGLNGEYKETNETGIYGYKLYNWIPKTTNCRWDKYADIYKYDQVLVEALVYDDAIFAGPGTKGFEDSNRASYRDELYKKLYNGTRYYWEHSYKTIYYTAENGAKTAHYVNTNSTCSEKCEIFTRDNTKECNIPGSKATKTNDTDMTKYAAAIQKYEEALAKCAAKVTCYEKEKTTYYTMEAKEKDNNNEQYCSAADQQSGKQCKKWKESKDKKTTSYTLIDRSKYIILRNASGTCYSDVNNDYHYINSISFPGYWVDYGKNQVYSNPSESKKRFLKYMPNEYCVDPKHGNVNSKWWTWDQNGRKESERASANITTEKEDGLKVKYQRINESSGSDPYEYNIYGEFKQFGYIDWNLIFDCFYAVNNNPGNDTNKTVTAHENSDSATVENIYTKPIALDEVFPSTDSTTKQSSVKSGDEVVAKKLSNKTTDDTGNVVKVDNTTEKREVGYNWSCDATNLLIKADNTVNKDNTPDYIIAPTLLVEHIQKEGENVYKDVADYHITLTSDNMKKIKSDYRNKSYFKYDNIKSEDKKTFKFGDKTTTIDFYRSSLLRNSNYVSNFTILGGDNGNTKVYYCNNLDKGNSTGCYDILNDSLDQSVKDSCQKLKDGGK